MEGLIALAVLLVIVLIVLVNCIKIVPQAHAMVIERLGGYLTTWSVGLHLKVPFIDRIAKRVILKEQVVDFPPQPVITKDNVTMQIDTVVYFQITDPKLYAYGVENPIMAIENLTATTLRNIIGDLELDETLTSRETPIMPQSVLGGAAVMMFSSIVVSGIQLITKWPIGPRNVTIVSVALGLGYGLGSNTAILVHLPQAISLIFGGSGIVPAAFVAIILNILLPKDK